MSTGFFHMGCQMNIILHLPISIIRISDIGKSFSDICKSSYFPISEIRITDIGKSNFRCRKIILIYRYRKIIRFTNIGNKLPISVNHFDFPISVNQSIYRYRKFEFPISVIQHDLPISENQLIYRYRKLDFPISEIRFRISDIRKSTDLPHISNSKWFSDIGKSADLPVSENRFTGIEIEFWFTDIGKSPDFPISENRFSDIGNSFWISDIGKLTDLPISANRISDIVKSNFR